MSSLGASISVARKWAATSRSSIFVSKLVDSNSPSLSPSHVKSNRKTAKPAEVSPLLIFFTAVKFLEQVKQ